MTQPDRGPDPSVPPAPRLTVIVPCWQSAGTIERAIDSVLEEHDVPLEVIVIDDGSTDGTPDVVAAVAVRDPRVILVRSPANEGVSAARNRGLVVARGEWLAFLDADDRLLPGGIAALVRPTSDPAVRVVIGQRVWTDGASSWVSPVYDIPDIREPGRKAIASHPGLLSYASATGKLLHRSLLTGLRFEGRVLGDQPWTIRAMLRAGDGIEVIGETVYEWWRTPADRYVATITAASRASAERGAEAATIARTAYHEVSDEVETRLTDPAARRRVRTAYLDRLVRSDLSGYLRGALERRDPATAVLLDAISDLLGSVPGDVLRSSRAVTRRLILPPMGRWTDLVSTAKPAYWRMVRIVGDADPALGRRTGVAGPRGRLLSLALRTILSIERRLGSGAAGRILAGIDRVRRAGRRLRRR